MRQLVYTRPGHVEWQRVPEPALTDPGAAIVTPLAVARCDLDAPMAARGIFPGPFPVGHETAGVVTATGADVLRHRPGDTVIVPFQISCGHCGPCRAGTFAACATYMAPIGGSFGFGSAGGGHGGAVADRLLVPSADHLLVPAPPDLPATTLALLSDNVVDGFRAVGPALAASPGADVLVAASAPGSVPLYAIAAAVALGGRVRYVDTDPRRVVVATALGAEAVLHEGPWPRRFDPAAITVDATGSPDGLATVIRSTARYGHCTVVSIAFEAATPVPLLGMYTRGITLHTSRADSLRYLPDVLGLMASGTFDPTAVPATVCPWEQAAEAWLEPAVKLVVARNLPLAACAHN
jgi:threonine dehydrogenase-like Zn-dependent dehydrogenase